jgi:ubiquinone/menaquinone biosynthesis C-methylase UbiE|tara:strand:+ start:132 stop:1055 length:924 start_codon:yes stop_codon:yes gene_type:complete
MFDDKYRTMIGNEKKHYSDLLHQQKDSDKIEKIEPKVSIFDYAYRVYNDYLISKMPHLDFEKFIVQYCNSKSKTIKILSLGSGTGDWEVGLLEKIPNLEFELVDINEELLIKTQKYAEKNNLKLKINIFDVNKISLNSTYDLVIVRSSLHHFIKLEHIFEQINDSLISGGAFLVIGEVIGRNGEKLYPETKEVAQKLFDMLPPKYRLNNYTNKVDTLVPDIDHSVNSFESIRSEDILPLLLKYFEPKEYVCLDAFLSLLLDFRYGPNYDINEPLDKSLAETIAYLDKYYISNSILKPTCLFGIFNKK